MPLEHYSNLSEKEFWNLVTKNSVSAETTAHRLFDKAERENLTQEEAEECLNALFLDSHRRIREAVPELAKHYPTVQLTPGRLGSRDELWWVDHFTAGISAWSTLSWFSSKLVKKKSGKTGLAGASTHFVLGHNGLPFYIIHLDDGAWHEPRRNKDSISIEMVNAGPLHMMNNQWHYWARKVPPDLVKELPPVRLDVPYKSATVMQPFTLSQIRYNALLKKIVMAALPGKLVPERMTQHSDWRDGKFDMGPLWPLEDVNAAALENIPLDQWAFYNDHAAYVEYVGAVGEYIEAEHEDDLERNPEYGEDELTDDESSDSETDFVWTTKEVQKNLDELGYTLDVDGLFGPQTKSTVKNFQRDWNRKHPGELLKVDGIPGPKTCSSISKMLD